MGATETAGQTVAQTAQNFLRILVDPSENDPEVIPEIDIVAVHGLNPAEDEDHAANTWTKGGKMWLRDFLPKQLPTARILLFGYNANLAFRASSAGVLEQALNLLNRLRSRRRKEHVENRPIVFIAHSLGGIIVKRALYNATQIIRYAHIREVTYGIVFFGTPHQGGDTGALGQIGANVVRAVYSEPDKNDEFLQTFEKDSLFADTMVQDFRAQAENFKVISCYETRAVPGIGIIVDAKSASLGMRPDQEIKLPLDLDHRDICRFSRENDDDYEQVSDEIVELVNNAISEAKKKAPVQPVASSIASPASPDPAVSPLDENEPENPPRTLAASHGLGIQELDSKLDNMSIASSVERGPQSESTIEEHLRRQSTSTSMTSPSLASHHYKSEGKYTKNSPSLGSSIKMNVISDWDGKAMRTAAAAGKKDEVMRFLDQGCPIDNSGIWDGYTALADAAVHGQDEVVALLLRVGANPAFNCMHSTSKYGSKQNTPLALAAGAGHGNCVKLLLAHHTYERDELDKAYRAAKYKNKAETMRLIQAAGGGMY